MLRNTILAGVLGIVSASSVLAQTACPCAGGGGTRLTGAGEIATLLRGNTVCGILDSERWQEFHRGGGGGGSGPLFEMGNVPNGEEVGTWDANNTGGQGRRITYSYGTAGSGGTYHYAVCQQGSNVHFCGQMFGGRDITNATLVAGRNSCGFPVANGSRARP